MAATKPVKVALLGAGARGELNLATITRQYHDEIRFSAVAEPHDGRRERFIREYNIPPQNAFRDWREFVNAPKCADAVINTLPCRFHYESAMAVINAGYHMLLEKPMALEPAQCVRIVTTARDKNLILAVCVQNRFNSIYQRTRKLLDQGLVGQLINVDCAENIGYWHFVLSYVRGIHHNSSMSHSFMMAKGIHDLDLILWLTGAKPKRVSSFGSLKFFTPDNAPPGAPERCLDGCPAEPQCPFSAIKQYLNPGRPQIPLRLATGQSPQVILDLIRYPRYRTMASIVTQDDLSESGIKKALAETSYGRCVYHAPNNVVDHQTVSLELDNGVTVSYSLSGFSLIWERTLNFHGGKGEILTRDFSGRLETRTYQPARVRVHRIPYHGILHGGGDRLVLRNFAASVRAGDPAKLLTPAASALTPHLLGFAAEQARTTGTVVDLEEFTKSVASGG